MQNALDVVVAMMLGGGRGDGISTKGNKQVQQRVCAMTTSMKPANTKVIVPEMDGTELLSAELQMLSRR